SAGGGTPCSSGAAPSQTTRPPIHLPTRRHSAWQMTGPPRVSPTRGPCRTRAASPLPASRSAGLRNGIRRREFAARCALDGFVALPAGAGGGDHDDRQHRPEGVHAHVPDVVVPPGDDTLQQLVTVADGRRERRSRRVARERTGYEGGDRAPREPGGDAVLGEMRALEVLRAEPGEGERVAGGGDGERGVRPGGRVA